MRTYGPICRFRGGAETDKPDLDRCHRVRNRIGKMAGSPKSSGDNALQLLCVFDPIKDGYSSPAW